MCQKFSKKPIRKSSKQSQWCHRNVISLDSFDLCHLTIDCRYVRDLEMEVCCAMICCCNRKRYQSSPSIVKIIAFPSVLSVFSLSSFLFVAIKHKQKQICRVFLYVNTFLFITTPYAFLLIHTTYNTYHNTPPFTKLVLSFVDKLVHSPLPKHLLPRVVMAMQ